MRAALFTVKAAVASLVVLQALVLACLTFLVIDHFPDNHTAPEIRLCYILPIVAISLAFSTRLQALRFMKAAAAGSMLFLLLLLFVDFGNILVQYDEWCHRRMPSSLLAKWFIPGYPE